LKKFLNIFLIVSFTGCLLISGCGDKEEKNNNSNKRRPVIHRNFSKVILPNGVQKVVLGDTLNIKITASTDTVKVDSIHVIYKQIKWMSSDNEHVIIPSNAINETGTPRLIAKVYLSNSKTETFYPKFSLLPLPAKTLSYTILNEYPHDITSYTQGLFIKNGFMYEGTGQEGKSKLIKLDYKIGKVSKSINLETQYFGEGITSIDDKIYQITWKNKEAFVYDLEFNKINTFQYQTEGWGLTNYGDTLVMSDGTNQIYFRDKNSFEKIRVIKVHDQNGAVDSLNELEMVNNYLFANVYQTDMIVMIDPVNGSIKGKLDLSLLFPDRNNQNHPVDVLNGIAYQEKTDTYFVTGKWWPKVYEIKLK